MTLEQKDDVIQKYCGDVAEEGETLCSGCKIKHLCSPIEGAFERHPEILEQAYELIKDEVASPVVHPSHYNQGGIECLDAMVAAFGNEAVANFCIINAFKYCWRSEYKNGVEDIDKAIFYLNKYKELKTCG
jgi:hypothetical protein